MKLLNSKKGQIITSLQSFIMGIVTIGVILAIGLYILSSVGDSMDAGSAEKNATTSIISKLGDAPTWIGLLIVVVFASAILGYFYVQGR